MVKVSLILYLRYLRIPRLLLDCGVTFRPDVFRWWGGLLRLENEILWLYQ